MNSRMGASIQGHRPERHLRFLRFDAEHDEFLPSRSPIDAALVEQVFLVGEADLSVSVAADSRARSLCVKVRQIPQKRLQSFLLDVSQLLHGHWDSSFFLRGFA
jgi:hypothetical protein